MQCFPRVVFCRRALKHNGKHLTHFSTHALYPPRQASAKSRYNNLGFSRTKAFLWITSRLCAYAFSTLLVCFFFLSRRPIYVVVIPTARFWFLPFIHLTSSVATARATSSLTSLLASARSEPGLKGSIYRLLMARISSRQLFFDSHV